MYILYNLLLRVFLLFAAPLFFAQSIASPEKRKAFAQKLGWVPGPPPESLKGAPRIWVHAVSLGEVSAVHPLIRGLREAYPASCILLSTGTVSGQNLARERVGEATDTFYFPIDLRSVVRKVIRRVRPDLFILAETEIWPNFLRAAKEEGARTLLVNGRISDRSFQRYRRSRFFWAAVLDHLDVMSMIRVQDGERMVAMGGNPVNIFVNGNCKFDQAAVSADPAFEGEMRRLLGISGEPVFVAGSTHEGEEEPVIEAFQEIRGRYPEALLVLVPRHVDRVPRVEKVLEKYGVRDRVRRSRLNGAGRKGARVVLWDTFGELFKVYSVASVVFCGASLVPKRGQNILEPAAWGKVALYGPSMEDFLDAHRLLSAAGAGIMVRDGKELAERCLYLLDHPRELADRGKAGREALLAQVGAARRNLALAGKLLER